MVDVVVCDIEGTTTPIDFVHRILFPYAAKELPAYIRANLTSDPVQTGLAMVRQTVREEDARDLDDEQCIEQLLTWIESDRKHPGLKLLQGKVWAFGYQAGAFTSELYPDVLPQLKKWRQAGKKVGIYSSGSVEAQKLLFGHTSDGDVNDLLDFYFDTAVGGKKEADSYSKITQELRVPDPGIICFLSDVVAELDAAAAAGMQTFQVVRPGTDAGMVHPTVARFDQLPF